MAKRRAVSDEDRALFRRTAGEVQPIEDDRHQPPRQRKERRPTSDEPAPPRAAADVDALVPVGLETGDVLWFARPGLQHKQLRRLRRGQIPIEAEVDLHGMSTDEAYVAMMEFLQRTRQEGRRCVRIIHGKGYGSRGGGAIIKTQVDRWLRMHTDVVAFCSARPADGGTGAVYVLVRR